MLLLTVLLISGCAPQDYLDQADSDAYDILDARWQDNYGPQSKYRIAGATEEPNLPPVQEYLCSDGTLPLEGALRLATTINRDYQSQRESLYLTALELTGARHNFEARFFGVLGGRYTRGANDERLTGDAALGFNQSLAYGADVSMAIAADWLRYLTGDPRTSLSSALTAAIRQPLLRGAGRLVAQENLTQAERNTYYALRSFARFRKRFIVGIVSDYLRVLQALDSVQNAANNYENLVFAEQRVSMMAEAGRLPLFEVQQAQQQTLEAWDSYLRSQQSYEEQLDSYKVVLGLPPGLALDLDPNTLSMLGIMGIVDPNFTVEKAVEVAWVHRLDLATASDQVADAQRRVKIAEDALRPELGLVAGMNVPSREPTGIGELRFDQGDYYVGFDADLGLDRLSERNNYRRAYINLRQQERAYELARDSITLEVRDAYRSLRQAAARHRIQSVSLELAQHRVESTTLLLDAGQATTRDFLEAQAALLRAQNARTDALVSYVLASLRFARDVGVLDVDVEGEWIPRTPQQTLGSVEAQPISDYSPLSGAADYDRSLSTY